jgi:hypothetical protein
VNSFVIDFLTQHPVGSVNPEDVMLREEDADRISDWAHLLAAARAGLRYEGDTPVSIANREAPWKVIDYFKDLTRGHALIHSRAEVTEEDLALVGHIALSSIPGHLSPILRQLQTQPTVDVEEVRRLCAENPDRPISDNTARRYMKELDMLGVCDLGRGTSHVGSSVRLVERFAWLLQPTSRS